MKRFFVALLLGLSACGRPSLDALCEDLTDNQCANDTCVVDGNAVAATADQRGCTDKYLAYFDCIDRESCGYQRLCVAERNALMACTGDFPPP